MEELLRYTAQKIVTDIQNEFDRKRVNDTGKGKASLSYRIEGNTIIIEGLARVMFLEFGRRPGGFPPIDVIQAWVERKLNVDPEKSRGVAFVIARKIAEKGTDILTYRSKGLQIELLIADINDRFLSEVTAHMAETITGGLVKTWVKI
jgi:hypothetical protein